MEPEKLCHELEDTLQQLHDFHIHSTVAAVVVASAHVEVAVVNAERKMAPEDTEDRDEEMR